jgi:hypothetical protein
VDDSWVIEPIALRQQFVSRPASGCIFFKEESMLTVKHFSFSAFQRFSFFLSLCQK